MFKNRIKEAKKGEKHSHPADGKCRICFCAWLKGRIERAVEVRSRGLQ